jgi:DNA transformation protein
MPSTRNEFVDFAVELMASWAPVSARKMFGGYGLYREGLMFALVADDELFFKTDADNVAQFEKMGCRPFAYQGRNRVVQMSYWSAPAASLDSSAEMSEWCQSAYGAALRAQTGNARKSVKGKRNETAR